MIAASKFGKNRFLLFVAVFVVAGGGYAVYKSLAATTQYVRVLPPSFASIASKNISFEEDSLSYLSGFKENGFLEPGGGGAPETYGSTTETVSVVRIAPKGVLNYASLDAYDSTRQRDCYIMRALGPTWAILKRPISNTPTKVRIYSGSNTAEVTLAPSNFYGQYCVAYRKPKAPNLQGTQYVNDRGVNIGTPTLNTTPSVEHLYGASVNVYADVQSFTTNYIPGAEPVQLLPGHP